MTLRPPPYIPWPLSLTHTEDGAEKTALAKLRPEFSEFLMLQALPLNIPSISVLRIFFASPALSSWIYSEPNSSSPKLLCLLLKPKATSSLAGPNHAYITHGDTKCEASRTGAGAARAGAQGTFCPAK